MNRKTLAALLTMIAVAVLAIVPALAEECVTTTLDSPFRLPDGRLYPAGPLTLCDSGKFSPVDSMHRILVGGATIGVFRSRRRNAETESMLSPEIVFNRQADGSLDLIGYALPVAGHAVAYRLKGTSDIWQASWRHLPGGSSAPIATIVAVSGTR